MRKLLVVTAAAMIGLASSEADTRQLTGCLVRDTGALKNFKPGDKSRRTCVSRRETKVRVPDVRPVHLEMVPAPHDQGFNRRELVVQSGVTVNLACRTEHPDLNETSSQLSVEATDAEVIVNATFKHGEDPERVTIPTVIGPESALALAAVSVNEEFSRVGFLEADIFSGNVFIKLRLFMVTDSPPDAACFFHGEVSVTELGKMRLDNFPD